MIRLWAILALLWAGAACAQPVTPETVTPIFWHGAAAAPDPCSGDGHTGAPAGAVPLYPTLTPIGTYPFAPTCQFPERDYGVGATGLGTPQAIATQSTSGQSVLHLGSGNIPGYFATGQWAVDLSDKAGELIPPGTTITALNSPSAGDVSLSANLTGTVSVGDKIGSFTDIGSWTPTTGWSKDNTDQILSCNGAGATISGVAFLDWDIQLNAGCTFTVTNLYVMLGTVQQRGNIVQNAGSGGTIEFNTINQRALTLNPNVNQGQIIVSAGTVVVEYNRLIRGWSDCFDGGGQVAGTIVTVKFNSCINNGQNSSGHGDVFQNFGTAGTSVSPTFQHNTVILNGDGPDTTQGTGCGDGSATGTCLNPTWTDNLFFSTAFAPNYWCLGFLNETSGTATCTNNFALPAAFFFTNYTGTLGGSPVVTGNINMQTGAACTTGTNNC